MRRRVLWQAGIVAVLISGAWLDSTAKLGLIGAGAAEAKEYYTKKRVNGRWITGRFQKRGASGHSASEARMADTRSGPKTGYRAAETLATGRVPATLTAPPPLEAAPALRPGPGQPSSLALPAASPPREPPAAAAPLVPAREGERLDSLRQALQARANTLTTAGVPPEQASRQAPEPHSVSLDFQTGIKTTLFSDGSMVREPFDVAALKTLAAVPAAAKGVK